MKDIPIFILSYNRPDRVKTLESLKNLGCAQPIYIVVSDDDPKLSAYMELYKDSLIIFSKKSILAYTDTGINRFNSRSPIYARNFVLSLARKNNYNYFCMLDDDLDSFRYRFFDNSGKLKSKKLDDIEKILQLSVDYMEKSGMPIIGFGHAGSYIGGSFRGGIRPNINQFLIISQNNIDIGNFSCLNCEDMIKMLDLALLGKLPLEIRDISFSSPSRTISTTSGTEYHSWFETNFLAVIYYPSAITVRNDSPNLIRKNKYLLPKIISGRYKNDK